MRISTAATLALTILLATTTLGAVAATQPAPAPTPVERSPSTSASLSPALERPQSVVASSTADPPLRTPDTRQVIRIQITEDGDAVWTIESRFLVTNESEAETFSDHANAVVSGERTTPYGPELFEPRVSIAAESTGRDMTMKNAGWNEPRIEQLEDDEHSADGDDVRVGIISYSFTWTNFATVDDGRIHVGDTFQSADLFRTLDAGQRLIIEPPSDNYGFVDAPTGTENGALVWDGPHRFDTDGLEITILRGAGSSESLLSGTGWLIASLFGLVIVGGGAYLLARRTDAADGPLPVDRLPTPEWLESLGLADRPGRGDAGDERGPATTDGHGRLEDAPGATAESPGPDGTESGVRLAFEESVDDEIDPELLSDEERVLRLLKKNSGRMKQASIVKETGWSNAKVSQLLSQMDDDDEIEKLRIGRENLITLPDVDPTELE